MESVTAKLSDKSRALDDIASSRIGEALETPDLVDAS
jgi:hypothetical protein